MTRGKKRDAWLCGYATALANVWRCTHDQNGVAFALAGFSVQRLRDAGVEEYDLAAIEEALAKHRGTRPDDAEQDGVR